MCDMERAHRARKCRRKAKWFIKFHAVDLCNSTPPREINVCKQCFAAHIALAERTIASGFRGDRSTLCQGCLIPLVRLSSIVNEVGRPCSASRS